MKPVAVIGAGITGLTAAWRLRQQGVPVTVYEASDRGGGVIRTTRRNGFLAESGPNTILETSPVVKQLVDELGLGDRRLYADGSAKARYIVRGARPIALPTSPAALFSSPLFSLGAKLNILREPFRRARRDGADESLASFVERRLGREFLDYAINPFVAGVYAGDPARLSVAHAFAKLKALEDEYGSLIKGQILGAKKRKARGEVSKQNARMFSFDYGLQVLTDTLSAYLHDSIRYGSRVGGLRKREQWSIEYFDDGFREEAEHSAVLLAIPAHQAASIGLNTPRAEQLQALRQIYYPPVATIALGFRREDVRHPLDGFGMLIPEKEGFNILGSFFSSSLFPNRAPAGCVTLTSFLGGVRAPHLASGGSNEMIGLVLEDLRKLLGVTGAPIFEHVAVYPQAIPQYEVGYGRFKQILTEVEESAGGLFFAGHYRDGISVADCIVSGHNIASRVIPYFESCEAHEPAGVVRQ